MRSSPFLVTVPLSRIDAEKREAYAARFRQAHVGRVFICPHLSLVNAEKNEPLLAQVKENVAFFKNAGFQTGIWISAFGHGGRLSHQPGVEAVPFTVIHGIGGTNEEASYCPADPDYIQAYGDRVAALAGCGADLLLLDDDYRLAVRPSGVGCCCPRHMKLLARRLGYPITREELRARVFGGAPSRERQAWLDVMGETLESFARTMRRRVDEQNPEMRLGFCAVHSTWGMDGTDALRLTRIFAGKTKPLLRLIGAPYWTSNSGIWHLPLTLELERMQAAWCRDAYEGAGSDIEVFSEGDAYPRPRYQTPSAYLEGFDFCLRADGVTDGILKYMCDYTSSLDYEPGYLDRHIRNLPRLEQTDRYFGGLRSVGVRLHEYPAKVRRSTYPAAGAGDWALASAIFPKGARLFVSGGIPTVYTGKGLCGAVFGDCGELVPLQELEDNLVLDATAAAALQARGVDVGFEALKPLAETPASEYFPEERETVALSNSCSCFAPVGLSPKAVVRSVFGSGTPCCYTYGNADGKKLLVYLFAVTDQQDRSALFCSYSRTRQLADVLDRFFGTPLPYTVSGGPMLYTLCKASADGSELAICLFNAFPDDVYPLTVSLAQSYDRVECMTPGVRQEGNRLVFPEPLPPYGFTAIRLKKNTEN